VRERTEIAVPLVLRAAVEAQARECVAGDREVGIGLVVPEEDVVASSSASPSERVAVTSTAAICDTIIWMRGLGWVFWKYELTRFLRSRALPT
jgi:hypothetical protein